MIQVLLRAILRTLKDRQLLKDPNMAPAQLASEIVNEMHIQEVGWLCGDEKTIKPYKECDDCYPIFRIRATE